VPSRQARRQDRRACGGEKGEGVFSQKTVSVYPFVNHVLRGGSPIPDRPFEEKGLDSELELISCGRPHICTERRRGGAHAPERRVHILQARRRSPGRSPLEQERDHTLLVVRKFSPRIFPPGDERPREVEEDEKGLLRQRTLPKMGRYESSSISIQRAAYEKGGKPGPRPLNPPFIGGGGEKRGISAAACRTAERGVIPPASHGGSP